MQFNLDHDSSSFTIRAYTPGEISITLPAAGDANTPRPLEIERISGSFIISPKRLVRDWPVSDIETLQLAHLEILAELEPELVLLGTGERLIFPATELTMVLLSRRIGVEVMDTAAACRTYNILMAEGRGVVAALINPSA
jgi:uncharacterized protein